MADDLKKKVADLFTTPFILAKAAKDNPEGTFKQANETVTAVMEGVLEGVTNGMKIMLADLKSKEKPEEPAAPEAPKADAAPKRRAPSTRKKKD